MTGGRLGRAAALALVVGTLGAGARAAGADPAPPAHPFSFEPPAGWKLDADTANGQARHAQLERHFGGVRTTLSADAYAAPHRGGALYVLWVEADQPVDDLSLAVRRTFDDLRRAPRASLADKDVRSAEMVSWTENLRDRVAEATFRWRHRSNETVTTTRILLFAVPGGLLREARADCVLPDPPAAAAKAACDRALASLKVTTPLQERADLGELPSQGEIRVAGDDGPDEPMVIDVEAGADAAPRPVAVAAAAGDAGPTAGMGPPADGVIYRAPPPRGKSGGGLSRWLYIAGGGLLVIAIYLTTRRTRDDKDRS